MKNDFLNDLRIASPCTASWQDMTGSDQVRLCRQCNLHVYDISEMTRDETAALIANSEGRICARLHRRADGTVITRDCPVGLRALRKRVARRAGAALAAVLSLSASVFAQTRSQDKKAGSSIRIVKVEKQRSPDLKPMVLGTVTDPNGASLSLAAQITLIDVATKAKFTTVTTTDGQFRFDDLKDGKYTLEIECAYFKKIVLHDLVLKTGEVLILESKFDPSEIVLMGDLFIPEPKPTQPSGAMILSGDLIRRLPY